MKTRIGLLAAVALGTLVSPGGAAADTTITSNFAASEVTAYGGVRLWTQRYDDTRFILMSQSGDGKPRRVRIKSAPEPFEPDLGLGSGSTPAAVIRRCDKRGDCDIHHLDLTTLRERPVRGASLSYCREGGASVWGGTVAFVRRRFGSQRRCRATDLVLRTKRGGARRVGGMGGSDHTDLNGAWYTAVSGFDGWTVFLVPRNAKRTVAVEATRGGNDTGGVVGGPVLDGDHVYYRRIDYDNPSGRTQQSFRRRRAADQPGDVEIVGTRLADSIGVHAGQLFYSNGLGVFRLESSG